MVNKAPLLAKLYLGPFQKAKLLVIQGNPKEFILEGHWEVNDVTGQGMSIGLWFNRFKLAPDLKFITPEEKRNCYLVYQTGTVEPETEPPEEDVQNLRYIWSLGLQAGVNLALSYLHRTGLIPGAILPEVHEQKEMNKRYNLRGEVIS